MEDTGIESDDGQQAALIHLDGQGTGLSAGDTGFKGLDFGAGARGQGMIGEEGEVCSCLGPGPG